MLYVNMTMAGKSRQLHERAVRNMFLFDSVPNFGTDKASWMAACLQAVSIGYKYNSGTDEVTGTARAGIKSGKGYPLLSPALNIKPTLRPQTDIAANNTVAYSSSTTAPLAPQLHSGTDIPTSLRFEKLYSTSFDVSPSNSPAASTESFLTEAYERPGQIYVDAPAWQPFILYPSKRAPTGTYKLFPEPAVQTQYNGKATSAQAHSNSGISAVRYVGDGTAFDHNGAVQPKDLEIAFFDAGAGYMNFVQQMVVHLTGLGTSNVRYRHVIGSYFPETAPVLEPGTQRITCAATGTETPSADIKCGAQAIRDGSNVYVLVVEESDFQFVSGTDAGTEPTLKITNPDVFNRYTGEPVYDLGKNS